MTDLDDLVARFAEEHHCPTIAWGVIIDGSLAASGGYVSSDAERLTARRPDSSTLYRIASMTKSFSVAATLALRDAGTLRLDDRIDRWAPELSTIVGPTADSAPITIRHLITMTSGLVTDDPWADRHLDQTANEFDEMVASGTVFASPTGDRYEYSNFGFAILGRVVERATGVALRDHVSERLLKPLGMTRTGWDPPPDSDPDWMRPLRWYDDERFCPELPPLGDGMIAPMGGLWSTIDDIAAWVRFLDDAFPGRDDDDSPILRRSSRREMQTPHTYAGRGALRGVPHSMSYGMGLRVLDEDVVDAATREVRVRRCVNHSGGFPGYGSNMRWLPGTGTGAIAFANRTYAPMATLTALLLDRMDDPTAQSGVNDPEIERLARRLIALFQDWTDSQADALFTDNVALDLDYQRRKAEVARLHPFEVRSIDTDGTGHFTVTCDRFTVVGVAAPPLPLRVQSYTITASR